MSTLINGRSGYPSYLSLSSVGSTGTFTEIAGITRIGAIGRSRKTIPLDLLGTTDGYDQVIAGGQTVTKAISFTGVYVSTDTKNITTIPELMDAGQRVGWKIAVAGTSSNNTWYGDAYLEDYEIGELSDDKVTFTFSMKPTGKPIGPVSSTT